jgi:hypothetical protein
MNIGVMYLLLGIANTAVASTNIDQFHSLESRFNAAGGQSSRFDACFSYFANIAQYDW